MYDKVLLREETRLLAAHISGTVCDAGCGDAEATAEYAKRAESLTAFDNSDLRVEMAAERLRCAQQATVCRHDVRQPLAGRFDTVISQRLLINLSSWEEQKAGFRNLARAARKKLLLSEGSRNGADALNRFRALYGLPPIPIPEHNVFIEDEMLMWEARGMGFNLVASGGLGAFYLLTRGVQPALTDEFSWESRFNAISASEEISRMLGAEQFARVKVWIFERAK